MSLDVLRGIALLGILSMNIRMFSMPASYTNPTNWGDLNGINLLVFILTDTLSSLKFMTLFSMLFGAGIVVFASRAEYRTGRSAALHYRRTLWLLIIGLVHAYLIFYGDVLVTYALCGMLIYSMRNLRPGTLLVLGILTTSVPSLMSLWSGLHIGDLSVDELAAESQGWQASSEYLHTWVAGFQGTWAEQFKWTRRISWYIQTEIFLTWGAPRAGGSMLIGMALYKWGVLSAGLDHSFYRKLTAVGFLVGLPIIVFGLWQNFQHQWSFEYSVYIGEQLNYWGSIFLALGYIGLVMLMVKGGFWPALQRRLAAVGRTALSNYILQSVICTLIFYGFGLGLFGQVERGGQMLIVIAVWMLQLWVSPWWLARYRFGPIEWLWRSLTYFRRQPMQSAN